MSTAGDLLRVVICGGLDAGKRTLLGQLQSATAGLSTAPRGYLFADMSGQGQYTYKLVTGASTADLAILLVDACNGMLSLTRWHCQLAALLGVRQVLLAVNKMDRVDYAEEAFRAIEKQAAAFALRVNIRHLTALPLAALTGDNLLNPSRHMPWYAGPTLLEALASAGATQSATLTLADEIDLASGDLNAGERGALGVADQFEATIIWMGQEPLLGGRGYFMQIGAATVTAVPSAPKYRIDIDTLEHLAAKTLRTNDIGVCNLSLDRPVPFDSVAKSREAGRFILIDRLTNATVGAGRLHFALRRAHNIHRQPFAIECTARARQKGQQPAVIWLTGLSGAGKSTIANLVEEALFAQGRHTYLLDGDNVRHGLNRDLGFTPADRVENVRRVAEVARLMADAGLIVIVCLISPYRQERRMARELVVAGEIDFIEVFVDTPLAIAEQRDPKGLYRKARRGDLANFTGIDAPYEIPEAPQLHLDAATVPPAASAKVLLACLRQRKIID